jgi:nitroimidazol reductase NimA-like FMN-containing flavoprotein (pyridoxamine 5'-phosphate oxidase superfamily)
MTPELDPRFSDPAATAVPWADARRVLESAELSWLTTVRADGRPHVTPLVTVWLDDTVHFCTGPDEQKGHNLAVNPQVAVTSGTNDWDRGLDVVVEGEAVRVTDPATLERLAAAWATKWDGRWTYGVAAGGFSHDGAPHDDHGGDRVEGSVWVYAVRPSKTLAFGKGTFSQTRYA